MDTNIKNGVGVPKDRLETSIYLDKEISETWKMENVRLVESYSMHKHVMLSLFIAKQFFF